MKTTAIIPMEPERGSFPLPEAESYIYQVKWDGIRLLAAKGSAGGIRLQGRKLKDKTATYPELVEALREVVNCKDCLLDGELIVLRDGRPSFYHIMQREKINSSKLIGQAMRVNPVHYMVFDLLRLNGEELMAKPLNSRLKLIPEIIMPNDLIIPVESFGEGKLLFRATKEQGLEGIVAKKKESPYVLGPRKSHYWKKIKHWHLSPLLVGGLLFRGDLLSSLLVGAYDEEGRLQFLGRVGSGLTEKDCLFLLKALPELQRADSPFAAKIHLPGNLQVAWLEPVLVAQVKFLEWTETVKLRAPSFQGFMEDRSPETITLGKL
ncbi:MAG: hypothetical protein GX767_03080 [Firmicutes bacterium]|nr:hypothetical protein [Bacillota bacterium]